MTIKAWIRREKYVIIHGQTLQFRIAKYCIFALIAWGLYAWGGWMSVGVVFGCLFALGLVVHFFFRWKTKAWTETWGLYRKLDLPE